MAINDIERIHYYQRQYLGAADFEAQQAYHRDMRRRHNLGHHTWGIVAGLELMEKDKEGGATGVDVFIQPGMAVDGFGREILLLEPYALPEELFAAYVPDPNLPDGRWIRVWLRYHEENVQPPRYGYAVCDVGDQFYRTRETFRVIVGELTPAQRRDKVTLAGKQLDADSVVADASIAYQEFTDASPVPRWLIQIGWVRWLPAPGGYFVKSQTDDEKKKVVSDRVYIGSVAESVLSPSESLRLRPRVAFADPDAVDFARIEGRLRVDGRIVAKKNVLVEGRIGAGTATPDVRLHVDGGNDAKLNSGSGYVVIGALNNLNLVMDDNEIMARNNGAKSALHLQADGGDLVVHNNVAKTQVVVKDDGKVGIGTLNPVEPLHVSGDDPDLALDISSAGSAQWAELRFKLDNVIRSKVYWSKTDTKLYIENKDVTAMVIDGGKIGMGTTQPDAKLHIVGGNDATLASGSGYLILGALSGTNLVLDDNEIMARDNGFKSPLHLQAEGGDLVIHNWQSAAQKVVIKDSGNIGIGNVNPAGKLDVYGRILRQGQAFSFTGAASHNAVVSVPWGTTDDWNIFVSPRIVGDEEDGSEADNGILKIECFASAISDTQWRITIRYKFKYWNDNPRTGWWSDEHGGMDTPSVNYLLVPR